MPLSSIRTAGVDEVQHGVLVRDPYRWLEDRTLRQTERWIAEQAQRLGSYFSDCDALQVLQSRVRTYLDVTVIDQPARLGRRLFFRRRDGDQEQARIYVWDSSIDRERLLVDPSENGRFASVGIYRISDDASQMAYEVSFGGGDKREVRVLEIETGHTLPDKIALGYPRGFVFNPRGDGYHFCHEVLADSREHTIQFRSLRHPDHSGTVFERPRLPGSRLFLTADTIHLGASWTHSVRDEAVCDFFVASRDNDRNWRPVFENKKLPYSPMLHRGRLFALSFENAPNGKVVELALDGSEVGTVIPERATSPRDIWMADGSIFVSYLECGNILIKNWTLEGIPIGDLETQRESTIQICPRFGLEHGSFFYTCESFACAPVIHERTPASSSSSVSKTSTHAAQSTQLIVYQRAFVARDGMTIPITLVTLSSTELSENTPMIMTSYGGFGASVTPRFSVLVTIMLELGAAFALPHIRGGGEFGKAWHDAGRAHNKQTTFNDFIDAGEWLCSGGFTKPSRLAIFGGSNSGLLVGVAITQRPDLFRAALCIAPLLDMVRYENFDQAAKWRSEYGSVELPEDFCVLHSYSPYHHVQESVNYPATLFVTGDNDDRCNPAHVRKMAALLQHRVKQHSPILVDYRAERGHSPVMPLSVRIESLARRITFLCKELDIQMPQEVCHETADC